MNCELCSTGGQGGETRCRKCGFDTSLPADVKRFLVSLTGFRPGDLLEGRYRIERILGFGGMSVVYKAHDDMLGEDVAIKVINRGQAGDDAKLFTDIRRDIVSTRKLAHPAIVKVHDLHKTDTSRFLTMEYVLGKDLASLIAERGKLGEEEVCRLTIEVAEALGYAHANGVVHCDIKPGNLLLTESGRVKIADFGISRVMQEENTGLTGLVVGTPAYMSPEQIRGERPTPLADMYALGIVMWHCLMGAPPYSRGDIAYQHVHEPLPPMVGVSPELERIVRKAASKAIADRYPSLDVMAQELRQFLMRRQDNATIMQTPPPRLADTIMQTPPPRQAVPIMQTPPPRLADTVMQTPPPQQATAVATTPPPQQVSIPAAAIEGKATAADTPPAGPPAMGSPPPGPPPVPPAIVPGGGTAQESPASPPASEKTKMILAAVAALLLGAVIWILIPRSGTTPPQTTQPPGTPQATQATQTAQTTRATQTTQATRPARPARPTQTTQTAQTTQTTQTSQTSQTTQTTQPPEAPERPANKCNKSACFEFFDAGLMPPQARPGEIVRCSARFTFWHDEGGSTPLAVEESVDLDVRSSRKVSRRIKAGQGSNLFDLSITVPDRARPGTYTVTLSVRRRLVTESLKLSLVVTK